MPENQIDISLSLLGQQSGPAFDSFVKSVAAIESSMQAMLATSTEMLKEANKATSQAFEGGGASTSRRSGGGANQGHSSGEASDKASTSDGPADEKSVLDHIPYKRVREALQGKTALGKEAQERYGPDDDYSNIRPFKVFGDRDVPLSDRLKLSAGRIGSQVDSRLGGVAGPLNWAANNRFEALYGANMLKNWFGGRQPGAPLPFSSEGADIGPMRMPWAPFTTEAGQHRITEWAQRRWKGAITPGVSSGDVGNIQQALYNLGWVEGNKRDRMEDALIQVKRRFPGMDVNQSAAMLDQGTRYGTGSVSEMMTILKDVPEVARAAGLGMNEMLASMDEVANSAQKQGATYQQGARWAQEAARITGRDPRISDQLAQNDFVQARTMATTGLMPQEQALLDPGTRTSLNSRSLQEMVRMFSGFGDRQLHDKYGGTTTIKGRDRAIAFAADRLGISPDVAKDMLKNADREQAMGDLDRMSRDNSRGAGLLAKHGDYRGAERLLIDDKYVNARDKYTSWGEMRKALRDAEHKGVITHKQFAEVDSSVDDDIRRARKEKDPRKRAELLAKAGTKRLNKAKEIIEGSTKKKTEDTAGKTKVDVSISFTGEAKKLLKAAHLNHPADTAKDVAKAGGKPFLDGATTLFPGLKPAQAIIDSILPG